MPRPGQPDDADDDPPGQRPAAFREILNPFDAARAPRPAPETEEDEPEKREKEESRGMETAAVSSIAHVMPGGIVLEILHHGMEIADDTRGRGQGWTPGDPRRRIDPNPAATLDPRPAPPAFRPPQPEPSGRRRSRW